MNKENSIYYFYNSLFKNLESTIGNRGTIKNYGSSKKFFDKKSSRIKEVDLDWKYSVFEGNKIEYSSTLKVKDKIYNIVLSGNIIDSHIENLEVSFTLDKYKGEKQVKRITGSGDSFKIIGTIWSACVNFIASNDRIKSFQFCAKENSKISLFKKLIQTFIHKINVSYRIDSTSIQDVTIFTFNKIDNKNDDTFSDVDLLVKVDDYNKINEVYRDIANSMSNNPDLKNIIFKFGHHPYALSDMYTKTNLNKFKFNKKVKNRIEEIFKSDKNKEGFNVIRGILNKELSLTWSIKEIKEGTLKYNSEEFQFDEVSCFNDGEFKDSIIRDSGYLIKSEYNGITFEVRIKSRKLNILKNEDQYTNIWNVKLESKLLYEKYYDMFKEMRSFFRSIFEHRMYRHGYFSQSQLLYLKKYYNIFNNSKITNNNQAIDIVNNTYSKLIELKIFKSYGRKN